jgi:RimJ/RimL family protein N-acetyltransferase
MKMSKDSPAARASRFIRETVTLRDGRRVTLRPIRPADADALMDLHGRLSEESIYMRFFGPKPSLTPEEAEYLAGVDYQQRFAIIALATDPDDVQRVVAVGRFDLVEPDVAEPAIVVRDDYQGTGLGRAILERMLELARGRGINTFSAEILAENEKMLQLLRDNGMEVGTPEGGIVRVSAPVEDVPLMFRLATQVVRSTSKLAEATTALRRPKRGRDE